MNEKVATTAGESVQLTTGTPDVATGTVGHNSYVGGQPTTVSGAAASTGGLGGENLIQADIDAELLKYNSDDTPIMTLMLKARRVAVHSPEVDHYMLDQKRSSTTTVSAVTGGTPQSVLPIDSDDYGLVQPWDTLLAPGLAAYNEKGEKTGMGLMLFVTGQNEPTTGRPIVRALNGPRKNDTDTTTLVPAIPAGTELIIMGNALYETQKEVNPNMVVPEKTRVFLQKRGMNHIVSDYFDSQKKRIPFTSAMIAEAMINEFKRAGARSLWLSRATKIQVDVPKLGSQYVYTTEGVRWQFKKVFQHRGKWTFEDFLALMKMFYTGNDIASSGILLAGKNLMEVLQCIDYSKHPEISIQVKKDEAVGWKVTNFHTAFGDFSVKHDPTLDRLGLSNSGALIDQSRLVHYVYKAENSFKERVEGEEATRSGILVWDALALKGSCHLWIDGEGTDMSEDQSVVVIGMWNSAEAPKGADLVNGKVYYLIQACPGINSSAAEGTMWQAAVAGSTTTWIRYSGEIIAR